jgi:hypothetical protein
MCRGNKPVGVVRQRRLAPKVLDARRQERQLSDSVYSFGNRKAVARLAGTLLALFVVFSAARSSAQTTKRPDKNALADRDQVLAEAACISEKYGPHGEVLYLACMDQIMDNMRASKKLRYLEGSWILTGELKANPWSRPGKFTRTERNSWQERDWSLVSHWTEDQPAGVVSGTTKLEYDGKSKGYVFHEARPGGRNQKGTGTLDAKTGTWTWLGHTRLANGKAVQSRWTVDPISATSYRFELEIASPTGAWTTILQGTGTKSR